MERKNVIRWTRTRFTSQLRKLQWWRRHGSRRGSPRTVYARELGAGKENASAPVHCVKIAEESSSAFAWQDVLHNTFVAGDEGKCCPFRLSVLLFPSPRQPPSPFLQPGARMQSHPADLFSAFCACNSLKYGEAISLSPREKRPSRPFFISSVRLFRHARLRADVNFKIRLHGCTESFSRDGNGTRADVVGK